jgi:aryl-alcohol dehydrogenase-like predicted oxidoreductase
MAMAGVYGPADESESIATIHAALDAGVTLLDTGDFYGMGTNEMLISRALEGRAREDVTISVKFGSLRGPDGQMFGFDASPSFLKTSLAYSLNRLGTDYVDIYRPARLDSDTPIEETAGAIAELIDAGYVRQMGLSEIGAETLRRAHAVTPISDLQIEYSLISRGIEREILPAARELGVPITAYGLLSRGLLSGHWSPERSRAGVRARMPRFDEANVQHNLELVARLRAVADEIGAPVSQIAIAWAVNRGGDDIIPLIGARTREQLADWLAAVELKLSPEQLDQIEAAVPADAVAGERYPEAQMRVLDSEH